MRKKVCFASLSILLLGQSACIGALGGSSSESVNPLFALLFGAISTEPTNPTPAPIDASSQPAIEEMATLADSFEVVDSSIPVPRVLPGNHVPVGRVYEADLKWGNVEFSGEEPDRVQTEAITFPNPVTLTYSYDAEALAEAGFLEEFQVWYFDESQSEWRPVEQVSVDSASKTVRARTSHFTPFVLTALPTPTGTGVAAGPGCMSSEFPIGGASGAKWSVFDSGFKYYLDRNYTINLTPELQALGFERALGIATCNGGSPHAGFNPCGTFDEHKRNDQPNYISFTAPADIDVFVMYDSRGPSDAPWLASRGFTDSGVRIATTDPVNQYKVYRRSYTRNSTVTLDGNRHGIAGATNIDTNYWVVIRPQGIPGFVEPSAFCQNPSASDNPPRVEALHAIPGANRVTLFWTNPADQSVTNVLLRRDIGIPTLSPSGGVAPTGTERSTEVYADQALVTAQTYFYTMFSLTANGSYSPAKVIEASTGVDTDGDGIKDAYEIDPDHTYASGLRSNYLLADSDGDGTDDLEEIINGTDPTNPDATPPTITGFTLTSPTETTIPAATFQLSATDNAGVTGYLVKTNNQRPRPGDPGWQSSAPGAHELNAVGTHRLYAFVRDAAGNFAGPAGPLTVDVTALRYPTAVYFSNYAAGGISIYRPDLTTGGLAYWKTVTGNSGSLALLTSPDGRTLYAANGSSLRAYRIDAATGDLAEIQTIAGVGDMHYAGPNTIMAHGAARNIIKFSILSDGRLSQSGSVEYESFRSGVIGANPVTGYAYVSIDERGTKVYNSSLSQQQYLINAGGPSSGIKVADPTGRFLYSFDGSVHLARLDSAGLIVSEDWSALSSNAADGAISFDGQRMYLVDQYAGPPSGYYVHVYGINQSNGALSLLGRYGPLAGLGAYARVALDRSENYLFVSGVSAVAAVRLDLVTGMPVHATVSPAANGNAYSVAVRSHWEGNAAPTIRLENQFTQIYRGNHRLEPVFAGYTWRRFIYARSLSPDRDLDICGGSAANTLTTASLTDALNAVHPTQMTFWPNRMSAFIYGRPTATGLLTLQVQFTDDAGACAGGAQTAVEQIQVRTAQVNTSEMQLHSSFPPSGETALRRFSMYATGSAYGGFRPMRWSRFTCRFSGLSCGPDFGGQYIRCDPFSVEQTVTTSEHNRNLQHCGHVFGTPNPLQAFFLQYRVDEIARENLIGGHWYEVIPD